VGCREAQEMQVVVPEAAVRFGFVTSPVGTHSSKTMMLRELSLLMGASSQDATYADLRDLAIEENVLLKTTLSNRREVFARLAELFGLRSDLLLYRALRDLWAHAEEERPLLALLCAIARDPLLRATALFVLEQPAGETITPQMLEAEVQRAYPDRYSPAVRASIGRNTISSWAQSGHLSGHRKKTRSRAISGPASTAYALLLGHLCGARGTLLFETFWAAPLDAPATERDAHAFAASRRGWIDYRRAGGVAEIGFSFLMRP
jgi:hypothetical protein